MMEYGRGVPWLSAEVLVYYENKEFGDEEVGKISFLNGKVEYQLREMVSELLPFTKEQLGKIFQSIINSPLRVSKLRSRLLPGKFSELFPGSLEHFSSLMRQSGPFRLETM